MSKFTLPILIGTTLILLSCSQSQVSISTPFTPASTQSSPSSSVASGTEGEVVSLSISEQIYQQATQEYFAREVSEVPLLSVKLLNYLARHNERTQVCDGETREPLVGNYFPELYTLSSQEYLVEQICSLGAYNITYSYFLYRPHAQIDETDMSRYPLEAYRRDEKGYFVLLDNANQLLELTVPDGDIIPLTFEQYQLINGSGAPVRYTSYIVGGRRLYNASQRTLFIFSKGRGMADCGSFAHYQLEEGRFHLLEYRYQECCSSQQECQDPNYGRYPEEYPRIYP